MPGYGFAGPPPPKSKLPLIIGCVVAALVLVGGGIGAVLLFSGGNDDKAADDPSPTPSVETTAAPTTAAPTTAAPTTAAPTDATPTEGAPTDLSTVVGTWAGTYDCAQGNTALTLTITPDSSAGGNAVEAIFNFGPAPDNPDVPRGSYLMEGEYADGSLALTPTRWIKQPKDYRFVPMRADVTEDSGVLQGTIDAPGCSTFDLFEQ